VAIHGKAGHISHCHPDGHRCLSCRSIGEVRGLALHVENPRLRRRCSFEQGDQGSRYRPTHRSGFFVDEQVWPFDSITDHHAGSGFWGDPRLDRSQTTVKHPPQRWSPSSTAAAALRSALPRQLSSVATLPSRRRSRLRSPAATRVDGRAWSIVAPPTAETDVYMLLVATFGDPTSTLTSSCPRCRGRRLKSRSKSPQQDGEADVAGGHSGRRPCCSAPPTS